MNNGIIPWADNFTPVIIIAHPAPHEHTPEEPFCIDIECPCHYTDRESLAKVWQWFQEGLITEEDIDEIIVGEKFF